ncbi:MAG: formate--tetrahydrofolate ligase, partial [Prevotellaceae bacterium]|nr:formate--tetrahydrofolate ligase [Prevotellaceae bacterium]
CCRQHCERLGGGCAVNNAFNAGGQGAGDLARLVVRTIEEKPSKPLQLAYTDEMSIEEKAEAVCRKIYGAERVVFSPLARKMMRRAEDLGVAHLPICIAKTQYSFSADDKAYGVPTGFTVNIRDLVINTGAEMLVLIAGDIMRMPGLPKSPQAERIDVVDGEIVGLS